MNCVLDRLALTKVGMMVYNSVPFLLPGQSLVNWVFISSSDLAGFLLTPQTYNNQDQYRAGSYLVVGRSSVV